MAEYIIIQYHTISYHTIKYYMCTILYNIMQHYNHTDSFWKDGCFLTCFGFQSRSGGMGSGAARLNKAFSRICTCKRAALCSEGVTEADDSGEEVFC